MKATTLPNGNLLLTISESERGVLATLKVECEDFGSDKFTLDWFEPFTCNSEYEWMRPEQIGALTAAPILGIYGETRPLKHGEQADIGNRLAGRWDDQVHVDPIIKAWGFMDYQVISLQQRLLDKGEAELQLGWTRL